MNYISETAGALCLRFRISILQNKFFRNVKIKLKKLLVIQKIHVKKIQITETQILYTVV